MTLAIPPQIFPKKLDSKQKETTKKHSVFKNFFYSVSRFPYCVERLPYCAVRQPYCIYKSPYFIRHLSYKSHPYKPTQRGHNKETKSFTNALFHTVYKQVEFQSILELIELRKYLQHTGTILHLYICTDRNKPQSHLAIRERNGNFAADSEIVREPNEKGGSPCDGELSN